MIKILVHVHVYYVKSWAKIEKILKNIVAEKSIEIKILTTVSADIDDSDIYRIERSRIGNMSLIRLPNYGYDIQPFFFLLNTVALDDYDYIVKIHTKNDQYGIDVSLNGRYISRIQWSHFLMNAIAKSTKAFKKNIKKMQSDPTIGMIGSNYFISEVSSSDERERELINDYIHKLDAEKVTNAEYVAGTMFIVRSDILKSLTTSGLTNEEFEKSESRKLGGTKAHAIERILGIIVSLNNKRICGFDKNWWNDFITSSGAHAIRRFLFDKRLTSNGKMLIRIFRIPIYNVKYPKE